jgi:hypothetical protein
MNRPEQILAEIKEETRIEPPADPLASMSLMTIPYPPRPLRPKRITDAFAFVIGQKKD